MAKISNPQDPFYVVGSGQQIDFDGSTAYWFREDKNGSLTISEQSLSSLRKSTMSLYAERSLGKFDWQLARKNEIDRLIKKFGLSIGNSEARMQIEALATSRKNALDELAADNQKLNSELHEADKASENSKLLKLLYMGASFAEFVDKASGGLSPADQEKVRSQTSPEDVLSELDGIEKSGTSNAKLLNEKVLSDSNNSSNIENQIIMKFNTHGVPTGNLPPPSEPIVVAPLR